ncbi:CBS domain containing protein [Natronococcus amylolyticus DSM 10524]|uniref:CBS domain containing protein n=1 Tax=Natronococcus amylolyticus DSM 10524 TaxID=1227497 RepID=L9XJ17_9EURY|nr:CBS domain-containing protein [Natronococcus amylolyticus]ELY61710.1 CBS domain containing protein [Natronococcus amylolyticus DSM 10524]
MDDIFVARVMSTDLQMVTPETLVEDAGEIMRDHGVGSVIVVDEENRLEGILTTTDFVDIVAESQPKAETSVSRYMTTDVTTTDAQAGIRDAADLMVEHGFHHLPVVDDEEGVIGIVTTTDLTAYLSRVQSPSPA